MADPELSVVIQDETNSTTVDPETGTITEAQPDGSVVVRLDQRRTPEEKQSDFYANLADEIDPQKLSQIANDLCDAISADDASRSESLETYSRALELLGLKIEPPKGTASDEGTISSVTNPLMLEGLLKSWANAQAELLPAAGPVKVKDDGKETKADDELAEALERDLNHYLTVVAPEYYPDTQHMLLWGTHFRGSGFKKVYRCPIRQRPVSESVAIENFIVSDATKDLRNCGRMTHQIHMRPSVMKRMMMIGAYRDIPLTQPTPTTNAVEEQVSEIQGVGATPQRPEDQPYTIWECQCEWDLPEFAPAKFKDSGVPLPYLVSIDKDTQAVLAIRRDWNEDDEDCHRKRMYVRYPYIPGPGFYGTGLLNILGNASAAMTAAWREALDCGMFANFPGGLISKLGSRQNTSEIKVAPGEFKPVETNGMPINQIAMPMPYKDVTPGLLALMDKITGQAQSAGGSIEIPTGEGVQNVPVGTMLAQIEQATKIMAAAHKGMHTAQSEEIQLIVSLFRENPEDFWRSNKVCTRHWDSQTFIKAIDDCMLVPVSDPNVPSHMHRVAKAIALVQLQSNPAFAQLMNPKETLTRCLNAINEDPEGLVIDPMPPQPQQDLGDVARLMDAQTKRQKVAADIASAAQKSHDKMVEIEAKKDIAQANLAKELVIHQNDTERAADKYGLDVAGHNLKAQDLAHRAAADAMKAMKTNESQTD